MSPEQQRKLNNIAGVIAAQVLAIDEDATMSGEVPYEDSTYEDSERRQLAAFVGSKAQYYLNKWAPLLRSGTGSAGFNWAAFFLWGLWLAYRKMYKVALIFYAIIIVEAVLEQVVFVGAMGKPETPQALWPVVLLVVSLICGAYGNRWYLSHARAAVSEHSREGLPEDALLEKLSNRGGTSLAASLSIFALAIVVEYATLIPLEFLLSGD
jgi:hypothetical protein